MCTWIERIVSDEGVWASNMIGRGGDIFGQAFGEQSLAFRSEDRLKR